MADLRTANAKKLLGFVGDAQTIDGPQPFTTELLDRLAEVMESEFATYQEFDVVSRRLHAYVACSRERAYPAPAYEDAVSNATIRASRGLVETWSEDVDRHTRRRFETNSWAHVFGVIDCASTVFASHGNERALVILHRQERDFTERDRRALVGLHPHVSALIRDATARRRLAGLTAAVDADDAELPRGTLVLGGNLRIEHASPAARRILRSWFVDARDQLPPLLEDWLRSGARREPLHVEGGAKRLLVESPSAHALVLTERAAPPASLTKREREVLNWVAAGKSTSEIARGLWITPATVAKHLEHIYRKLGVTNRTAALAAVGALRDSLALPGDDD